MPDPLPPHVARALSAPVARALVSAFGDAAPAREAAVDLARALFEERASPRLTRAAALLARLGTAAGQRAIVEAARALGDGRADAWSAAAPADVAATLLVERAT